MRWDQRRIRVSYERRFGFSGSSDGWGCRMGERHHEIIQAGGRDLSLCLCIWYIDCSPADNIRGTYDRIDISLSDWIPLCPGVTVWVGCRHCNSPPPSSRMWSCGLWSSSQSQAHGWHDKVRQGRRSRSWSCTPQYIVDVVRRDKSCDAGLDQLLWVGGVPRRAPISWRLPVCHCWSYGRRVDSTSLARASWRLGRSSPPHDKIFHAFRICFDVASDPTTSYPRGGASPLLLWCRRWTRSGSLSRHNEHCLLPCWSHLSDASPSRDGRCSWSKFGGVEDRC